MRMRPRRLLVVSHVVHYCHDGRLHAFGPYSREIDRWAALFEHVTIAAPCRRAPPPFDALPFEATNLAIASQRETGGTTFRAKVAQLLALPALVWTLAAAMRRADAIHVRCPGNLGLLGSVLAPLFSRYVVAKYAGQWSAYPGEPWTERLQRAILRSRWWRGPVTVYGHWPDQPAHVVPFFTSVLTDAQVERARVATSRHLPSAAPRVLYVGRLDSVKNVDVLLAALAHLKAEGIDLDADIVGDGPERTALEQQAVAANLAGRVTFHGAVDLSRVLDYYERADVLVLASEAEGWPKAIAEAMTFGLVCIGADRGLVPKMLGDGRGLVVPPRDLPALAAALRQIAAAPERYQPMRRKAAQWAQRFSLDQVAHALRGMLAERWDCAWPA